MAKLIHLNTAEADVRLDGSSDVIFHFQQQITVRDDMQLSMGCANATIPSSFYVVNSSNDHLTYQIGQNTQTSLSLDHGNPTIYDLASELEQKLGSHFMVTYDVSAGKLNLIHMSDEFQLHSTSTCLGLLGFTSKVHTSTSQSLTSDLIVDLAGPRNILIQTPSFGTSIIDSRNGSNILSIIPNKEHHGNLIIHEPQHIHQSLINARVLSSIRLQLRDHDSKKIDLNGLDYSVTFQVLEMKV